MKISEYIKNIREQKHPLKFVIAKILMRLKISHILKIKLKHHVLRFYPTFLSRVLWIDNKHDHSGSTTEDFIWDYLQPENIFIDIGANIGTTTLEASIKVGSKGKCYSFEPNPKIFKYLKGNISLNRCKNVSLFNMALGDKNGFCCFSDIYTDESNSVQPNSTGLQVPMSRLDDVVIDESKIDLIKIDVLGYEKFVLLGAKKTLKNTSCIHFPAIENLYKKYNYDYKEVFNIFIENGFILCTILKPKILMVLSSDFKPKIGDYLAIKNLNDFLSRTNYKLEE